MPGEEDGKVFCQVIVDIVHENVAKPFTYLIPEGMELTPGQRVAVPFGHIEKEGVVTAVTGETVSITADSVCVHGDNPSALAFVKSIRERLEAESVTVAPLSGIV